MIHYLDDYLILDKPNIPICHRHVVTSLSTCRNLGVPAAHDKLEGPSTTITFLGLELDSVSREIRLPMDKLVSLLDQLDHWPMGHKTTKRKLLSLIGVLSFAAKAVPAGRLFLLRLITLSTKVYELHHHIRGTRARTFLPSWNGRSSFIDARTITATELQLYTDASGKLGCGAYYQGEWVPPQLATPSAAFKNFNSMAGIVCHRSSSPYLGTPMVNSENLFPL